MSYYKIKAMKIYRGISSKYIDLPFTPSANRETQIGLMEKEIHGFMYIELDSFKKQFEIAIDSKQDKIYPFYRNASPTSYYCYFLSLLFMNIKIRRNELIYDFFSFQKELLPALDGLTRINKKALVEFCIEEAYIPLLIQNKNNLHRFQKALVVSSYFQHLNLVFDNRTPTLGLDWTDDYNTAKKFGDVTISIDIEKYKAINESQENWGISSYKDPINKDNRLMQEQNGYIVFWPWSFTLNELIINSFGQSIDFKIEHFSL